MRKNNNIFWVSYSDLMTSLFFVMLVLFVLSIGYLNNKSKEVFDKNKTLKTIIKQNEALIDTINKQKERQKIEIERYKKLLKIEKQFKPLEEDGSFLYLKECKKYIIKDFTEIELFYPKSTSIKTEYKNQTIEIGQKIENFLESLTEQNPDLSYLLVIEGNVANNPSNPYNKNDNSGYVRSYKRALAVYQLWQQNNIDFRKYNVEVMICGSGFNGLCRAKIERNNKRFSIQIIPKIETPKINEKER